VKARAALLLVGLSGIGLAACGSSSSTEGGPPPTPAQFAARADAICRGEQKALKPAIEEAAAAFEAASTPEDVADAADQARAVVSEEREWLDRLRDLPRPPGESRSVDAMLSVAFGQASGSARLADAAEAEDEAEIETLTGQAERGAERYERLADGLGLGYCGHPH
jgi:hypothetical protein